MAPSYSQYECFLQYDPTKYDATHSVYFEVRLKTSSGTTGYARLYNITDTAVVSGSELSTVSTDFVTLRSSALTLPSEAKEYRAEAGVDGGTTTICRARLIIGG